MQWRLSKKGVLIFVSAVTLVIAVCAATTYLVVSRSQKTKESSRNGTTVSSIGTTTRTTMRMTTVSTTTSTSVTRTSTTSQTTTTERPIVSLTNRGDSIVAIYNTRAGGAVGGANGNYPNAENHMNAIDHNLTTKYLNFGGPLCDGCTGTTQGIDTGFIVQPAIGDRTIARAIVFATANDLSARDPLTMTLEGSTISDSALLVQASSWTLIYSGSTGISDMGDPDRMVYASRQNFSNTVPYKYYRLLITSRRNAANSVQYAEAHILGYIAS